MSRIKVVNDQRAGNQVMQAFNSAITATLKNNAYLQRGDGKQLFLEEYVPPGKDGFGALELAARYDWLDLSNTPVPGRQGNEAQSATLGLNWYFNPYAKLMFNWVHFWGDNTPLDPIGTETEGDALGTRLHLDF